MSTNNCRCDDVELEVDEPIIRVKENDYKQLNNIPSINGVDLIGNVSWADLGLVEMSTDAIEQAVTNAINTVLAE